MKALIFSGGEFSRLPDEVDLSEYSLVIAADAGYLNAVDSGVEPHIFVGDFDSVLKEDIKAEKIVGLNPVKDMTDTQEAIDIAIDEGAKAITILGALGNRVDHTLANIQLLKYAREKGASAQIIDVDTYITLVCNEAEILAKSGYCLSLLPLTDCEGVSVSGVYYPLENASMTVGNPYGISNEFVEEKAKISVKSGDLLLILCKS